MRHPWAALRGREPWRVAKHPPPKLKDEGKTWAFPISWGKRQPDHPVLSEACSGPAAGLVASRKRETYREVPYCESHTISPVPGLDQE